MPRPGITITPVWPGVYRIGGFNRDLNQWLKNDPRGRYKFDGDCELGDRKAWYLPTERLSALEAWLESKGIPYSTAERGHKGFPGTKPRLPDDLTPWQSRAIERAWYEGSLLCQHITGAGKSRIACEVINSLGSEGRTLIIAPKVVMETWETEQLPAWLRVDWGEAPGVWSLRQGRKTDRTQPGVVICSYGSLHRIPAEWKFDLIVFDEIHYGIHGQSARTRACRSLRAKNPGAIALGLTATPASSSLTNLWAQLDILCPTRWGTYKRWWSYFFEELSVGFEDHTKPGKLRADRADELLEEIADVVDYVSFGDVGDRLPPVVWDRLDIGDGGGRVTAPENLKAWRAEQQRTASERVSAFVSAWEQPPAPTAIIVYHRNVAAALGEALEGRATVIDGSVPAKQRKALLSDSSLAVITMRSITEGVDLRRFTQVCVLESYPVPLYVTQVLGRFVRLYAENPVGITFCRLRGSSDDLITERLLSRLAEQQTLISQGKVEGGLREVLSVDENGEEFLTALREACSIVEDPGEDAWGEDWED